MLMKLYCTVKDDTERHSIAHKITQFALSLEDHNFKVHLVEREHPTLDDDGVVFAVGTYHMHDELDKKKLLNGD